MSLLARLSAAAAALFLIAAEPAPAPDAPLKDPAAEARAQALFEEIRCVVCQHESIADSPAGLAGDVRREVRGWVAEGRTDDQIRAALVERWGDFVLFRPPLGPGTIALWAGPFLLILAGAAFLAVRMRRRFPETAPLTPEEERALAEAVQTATLSPDSAEASPDDGRRNR